MILLKLLPGVHKQKNVCEHLCEHLCRHHYKQVIQIHLQYKKKVIGFPLLPFNRNNDPNVIIGNSIDGLGMTKEAVERLINERFINAKEHDDSAKKTQKTSKTKKMKLILPEITPISNKSSKSRQGKRPRGRPPSLATKKSGGKRTRKQIKKHKKSSKSKKA